MVVETAHLEHPQQGFIPTSNGESLIFDNRVNSLIEEQDVIEGGNRVVRLTSKQRRGAEPRRRRLVRSVVRTYRSFVRSFVVSGGPEQTKMSNGQCHRCQAAVATP